MTLAANTRVRGLGQIGDAFPPGATNFLTARAIGGDAAWDAPTGKQ